MKIVVLGAGAWGTAIATVLAHNNHTVHLWCYEQEVVQRIQEQRCNTSYLPGCVLDKRIIPTHSLDEALTGASIVFEAIPVAHLRTIIEQARIHYTAEQLWVVLSKGLEQHTLKLPSTILQDVFGASVRYALLAGPSFAHDVARKQYTAVNLAGHDMSVVACVQKLIENDYFFVEPLADPVGMQWCAVLKNCIAVGVGILEGAGYTDNTKIFFLMQALHEVQAIVHHAGGAAATVYTLAGLGDLMLTTLGTQSRNVRAGKLVAQGADNKQIVHSLGGLPEGINALISIHTWLLKNNLDAPLLQAIYEIVEQKKAHDHIVHALTKTSFKKY